VKELLYQNAEEQKRIRRFRYGEFLPYADIDFDN